VEVICVDILYFPLLSFRRLDDDVVMELVGTETHKNYCTFQRLQRN
jgi:hypothetical protein